MADYTETAQETDYAVWATKDGREIPVRELEDSHLDNIIGDLEAGRLFPLGWSPRWEEGWEDTNDFQRRCRAAWLDVMQEEKRRRLQRSDYKFSGEIRHDGTLGSVKVNGVPLCDVDQATLDKLLQMFMLEASGVFMEHWRLALDHERWKRRQAVMSPLEEATQAFVEIRDITKEENVYAIAQKMAKKLEKRHDAARAG